MCKVLILQLILNSFWVKLSSSLHSKTRAVHGRSVFLSQSRSLCVKHGNVNGHFTKGSPCLFVIPLRNTANRVSRGTWHKAVQTNIKAVILATAHDVKSAPSSTLHVPTCLPFRRFNPVPKVVMRCSWGQSPRKETAVCLLPPLSLQKWYVALAWLKCVRFTGWSEKWPTERWLWLQI